MARLIPKTRKEIRKQMKAEQRRFLKEQVDDRKARRDGYFGNYIVSANCEDLQEQDNVYEYSKIFSGTFPSKADMDSALSIARKQFPEQNITGIQISCTFYAYPPFEDSEPAGFTAIDIEVPQ